MPIALARSESPSRPKTLLAVGYLRRSTDRQEQSIPDQKRAIEQYAERHGLRLVRCYTDDAISGTSTVGRKAFQSLMNDAQSSGCDFTVIIVYDVKRFGRVGNDEAGYYRHLLRQNGVEVRYVSENFSGDGTDDLLRPVKQWQAREESKDLSKVTIRGLLSKSETGFWMGGAPPFGYDLRYESQSGQFLFHLRYNTDGSKSMFDANGKLLRTLDRGERIAVSRRDRCKLLPSTKERIGVIAEIFRLYTEDKRGFKSIAHALNCRNVATARGPAWSEGYSGLWACSTVRAILCNPAYAGDVVWNRRTDARFHKIVDGRAVERRDVIGRRLENNAESDWMVVADAHPALISRRIWELAKEMMAAKPSSRTQRGINPRKEPSGDKPIEWTGPRARFLLSGLCTCAKCGSRYEGYTQRAKTRNDDGSLRKSFYYACGGYIRHGRSVCQLGEVPQEALEQAVSKALLKFYEPYVGARGKTMLAHAIQEHLGGQADGANEAKAKLEKQKAKLDRTVRNLLDNITATNRAQVDKRLPELEEERTKIEEKIERLNQQALSSAEVQELLADTSRFIGQLEAQLRDGRLEERQAALRRCVERIEVSKANEQAQIEVRVLPVVAGGAEASRTETITSAIL